MPTIEELFKNKKLQSGQTAQEQYGVRNTKDLPITPYNSLMTIPFKGVQKIRSGTNRFRETKLETETSGLRVLALATTPFLYGTDTIKFTTKERNIVEDMKAGAKGVSDSGILGTFLNKAEQKGKELLSKIGVTLPEKLIPTRIATNKKFGKISAKDSSLGEGPGGEYATMIRLQDIKNGNGNFWGKVIADNLQGKPTGNQIIGSALDLGKKELNKLLLGSPSQAAVNFAKAGGVMYDSKSPYSKVMIGAKYLPDDMIDMRNDLSTKYNNDKLFPQKPLEGYNPDKLVRPNVLKNKKTKYSSIKNETRDTIGVKRGMYKGSDFLNQLVSYNSVDGLKPDDRDASLPTLESYDFIPLKFWSVAKKAAVNFRAVVSGISENISPTWDNNKFVGNPFNFYTYSGIERTVSFSFKVFALNEEELISAWQKINFLTSLAYPQGYSYNNLGVIPPFIKFTLGSIYNNKEGYIQDLIYEIDDNTPWETATDGRLKNFLLPKIINVTITIKFVETVGSTTYIVKEEAKDDKGQVIYAKDDKGNPTTTPLMKSNRYGNRLYGYGASRPTLVLKIDTDKELNPDGSPKRRETVVQTPNANQSQRPLNPVAKSPKES